MAKKKRTTVSTKTQLLVATGAVLLLTAFGFFVGWLDMSMKTTETDTKAISLSDVTIRGESTCLVHNGDGPHTMECALGIKTASGVTYAVKGESIEATGMSLELTGSLTPASDTEKYAIAGTLTVKE